MAQHTSHVRHSHVSSLVSMPVTLQTMKPGLKYATQGALQGEAPLLLEIFAALFDGIPAKALWDAAHAQPIAQRPAKTAASRAGPPQQKPPQRHPRFGGIFVHRQEGGLARCAIGKAQHVDLLGPIGTSVKPSKSARMLTTTLSHMCCCIQK